VNAATTVNAPTATGAGATTKVIRYHGYRIAVPGAWPVFNLAKSPTTCVRFNRHALYLGQPGAEQQCPAHAVGRTEAILVQPVAAAGASATAGALPGQALPPVTTRAAEPASGSAATLALPRNGLVVTATWATRPNLIKRALRVRSLGAQTGSPARVEARMSRTIAKAGDVYTGLGFDPCAAPSMSQMSAWLASPYRAIGIYVGGTNVGCSQPNLTASWVSAERAAGWHLIPTYVGLQAPSNGCGCASITRGHAASQGTAAANDAVSKASALGITAGNPIYIDMENYSTGGDTPLVMNFLAAWTTRLHALGYGSGVYSNADSGISDLVARYGTIYTEPDDIWVADWNGQRTTSDPYVPAGDWASHQRLHQYGGGHNERYGGVTINVDGDYLDGATVGRGNPVPKKTFTLPDGTFVQVGGSSSTYRIAGDAPLYVNSWADFGGPQPVKVITARQFALLNPYPKGGTFLQTTSGEYYRVAGGAPLFVNDLGRFGSPRAVLIDEWDVDNAGTPASHLYPVPRNGAYIVTTTGRSFRIAGGAPFAIRSWSTFGGPQPAVKVDEWDIDNIGDPLSHLNQTPTDGTLVEGIPSHTYWSFTGAKGTMIGPIANATRVTDTGLARFGIQVPICVVPYLRHMTLAQVRAKLRKAHCRLGRVRLLAHPASGRVLRVVKQAPHARGRHAYHYQVAVTVA
jgi:hypothetical protein